MNNPENDPPNDWRRTFIKASDGEHPRRVMDMIYTCDTVHETQEAQERRRQELGQDRIHRAYGIWHQKRPRNQKPLSLNESELLEIAEGHPEVDREVFLWLKAEIKARHDFEMMRMEVGEAIFFAIIGKDSRFFYALAKAIKVHPSPDLFHALLALHASPGFTGKTLTEITNSVSKMTGIKYDRAHVYRECKKLGVPVRRGTPGPKPRAQKDL